MPELIEEILCLVDIKRITVFIMPTISRSAKFVDAGEAIQFKRVSGTVAFDQSHQIRSRNGVA